MYLSPLYTDHVLAELVKRLQAHSDRVDVGVIYVSDHGESLGENGLFLHGMPYAIAPAVQTRVPMLIWSSPGFAQVSGVNWDCVRAHAAEPTSHDHLFHTVLGLLDVHTRIYDPRWDRLQACRLGEVASTTR